VGAREIGATGKGSEGGLVVRISSGQPETTLRIDDVVYVMDKFWLLFAIFNQRESCRWARAYA